MKSLNMARREFREVFNQQPYHYVIVDATAPMSHIHLEEICRILNNVLVLANSMKGSSRIKAVGMSLVGADHKSVLPLLVFKINYQKIVRELANAVDHFAIAHYALNKCAMKDTLYRASLEAYSQFKELIGSDHTKETLEITILSCQSGKKILETMESIASDLHLPLSVKIQVVHLSKVYSLASSLVQGASQDHQSQETVESDDIAYCKPSVIPVQYGCFDFDEFQLERLFKNWLHDASNEQEHLRLFVKLNTNNQPTLIKCDLRPCLINPWTLPNGGDNLLSEDQGYVQFVGAPNSNLVTHKIPLYEMDCVKALRTSGICDSLLFGMPISLFPTRCWKMEWDEHQRNQTLFVELNEALAKLDLALLCKKRNQIASDGESSYFLIIPSGGTCMLVKSIAHRDLCLPRNYESVFDYESQISSPERIKEMIENLSCLTVEEKFNPLSLSTGLCSRLLNVKGVAKRKENNRNYLSVTSTSNCNVQTASQINQDGERGAKPKQTPRTINKGKKSKDIIEVVDNTRGEEERSIAHFKWNKEKTVKTEFQTATRILANLKRKE